MFYAHFVLSKKGPLAKIWLAAHWDKKLTKAHVFETNIESSVEGILQPKVKMALRTSGHLLLGIVRIYSRKAKYLLADCNEAFIKIKMAFRPGIVDLPEGNREAAVATITLPEVFHDFDTAMPDITIDMDAQVTLNQSRAEDITLKEDYGTLTLMGDDGFEDLAAFEVDVARDGTSMEEGFDHASLLLGDEQIKEQSEETIQNTNTSNASVSKPNVSLDQPLRDDGFGGTVGEGLLDGESGGLFEPAGLFDDAPLGDVPLENNVTEQTEERDTEELVQDEKPAKEDDASDDDMYDIGPGSMGAPSPPTSPESPMAPATEVDVPLDLGITANGIDGPPASVAASDTVADVLPSVDLPPPPALPPLDNTTLIHNEDESFALAPLDTTIIQGPERTVKAKRKRKLIVDEVKNISGEEMKSQLSDTTDIVTTLDLAPPTKRLMLWKETGGVEKLFALPGHKILSRILSRAYQRHLTTRSVENEDFGIEEDNIDLDADLEQAREDPDVSGLVPRKRQRRENIDQVFPQDLQMDSLHLDASRPSYASDHSLSHPSLDVQSFLQPPHHIFSQSQQMMSNMVQHPPPAHMIQQMFHHDVNHLAHLPDMMHPSIIDQGPSLHSITPSIHNVPSPAVSDAFNQRLVHPVIDSMSDHLLSETLPDHLQHSSINKQTSGHSPANHMNQQTLHDQLSHPDDHLTSIENNLHHCSENDIQSHMDGQLLQPSVDDDVTQTFGAEYSQSLIVDSNTLSVTMSVLSNNDPNLPIVSDHLNESTTQNCVLQNENNQQTLDQQCESTTLFDSLNNGPVSTQSNLQNQSDQLNESNVLQKANEFPISDDEDDYGAPGSVGPALPEEQMADETYEQFEERILTKRTTHMLHIINSKLEEEKSVNFASVVKNNKRKQVAQKFYTFLVLKKQQAVELEQNSSYGDLIITKGSRYNAVYNSN